MAGINTRAQALIARASQQPRSAAAGTLTPAIEKDIYQAQHTTNALHARIKHRKAKAARGAIDYYKRLQQGGVKVTTEGLAAAREAAQAGERYLAGDNTAIRIPEENRLQHSIQRSGAVITDAVRRYGAGPVRKAIVRQAALRPKSFHTVGSSSNISDRAQRLGWERTTPREVVTHSEQQGRIPEQQYQRYRDVVEQNQAYNNYAQLVNERLQQELNTITPYSPEYVTASVQQQLRSQPTGPVQHYKYWPSGTTVQELKRKVWKRTEPKHYTAMQQFNPYVFRTAPFDGRWMEQNKILDQIAPEQQLTFGTRTGTINYDKAMDYYHMPVLGAQTVADYGALPTHYLDKWVDEAQQRYQQHIPPSLQKRLDTYQQRLEWARKFARGTATIVPYVAVPMYGLGTAAFAATRPTQTLRGFQHTLSQSFAGEPESIGHLAGMGVGGYHGYKYAKAKFGKEPLPSSKTRSNPASALDPLQQEYAYRAWAQDLPAFPGKTYSKNYMTAYQDAARHQVIRAVNYMEDAAKRMGGGDAESFGFTVRELPYVETKLLKAAQRQDPSALVKGSHATGDALPTSDVDILFRDLSQTKRPPSGRVEALPDTEAAAVQRLTEQYKKSDYAFNSNKIKEFERSSSPYSGKVPELDLTKGHLALMKMAAREDAVAVGSVPLYIKMRHMAKGLEKKNPALATKLKEFADKNLAEKDWDMHTWNLNQHKNLVEYIQRVDPDAEIQSFVLQTKKQGRVPTQEPNPSTYTENLGIEGLSLGKNAETAIFQKGKATKWTPVDTNTLKPAPGLGAGGPQAATYWTAAKKGPAEFYLTQIKSKKLGEIDIATDVNRLRGLHEKYQKTTLERINTADGSYKLRMQHLRDMIADQLDRMRNSQEIHQQYKGAKKLAMFEELGLVKRTPRRLRVSEAAEEVAGEATELALKGEAGVEAAYGVEPSTASNPTGVAAGKIKRMVYDPVEEQWVFTGDSAADVLYQPGIIRHGDLKASSQGRGLPDYWQAVREKGQFSVLREKPSDWQSVVRTYNELLNQYNQHYKRTEHGSIESGLIRNALLKARESLERASTVQDVGDHTVIAARLRSYLPTKQYKPTRIEPEPFTGEIGPATIETSSGTTLKQHIQDSYKQATDASATVRDTIKAELTKINNKQTYSKQQQQEVYGNIRKALQGKTRSTTGGTRVSSKSPYTQYGRRYSGYKIPYVGYGPYTSYAQYVRAPYVQAYNPYVPYKEPTVPPYTPITPAYNVPYTPYPPYTPPYAPPQPPYVPPPPIIRVPPVQQQQIILPRDQGARKSGFQPTLITATGRRVKGDVYATREVEYGGPL